MPLPFIIIISIVFLILIGHIIFYFVQKARSDEGRQFIDLMCDDNWFKEIRLNVFMGYATDRDKNKPEDAARAWGIDVSNQTQNETGTYIQVCSERDTTPLQLFGGEPKKVTKTTMETIASQVTDDEINYSEARKRAWGPMKYLGWTTLILALLLAVEIVLRLKYAGAF